MARTIVVATLIGACSLVILAAAGCGGGSSPGAGSIEGYVFGQQTVGAAGARAMTVGRGPTPPEGYEPVQDAVVMVTGSSTIATTDAAGYFRIDGVQIGVQIVTISKSGYLTAVVQVTVVGGQLVTVEDALLAPSERKWTILVFLNADNDLEPFGIEDVNEMEMVGSSPQVDILVQMDRHPLYDTTNGDWTGCRRMRVIQDSDEGIMSSVVLQDMGEVDMGDWRVLRDFVVWGTTNYPAEHYMVVLWNHGAGWRMRAASAEQRNPATRGVSYDWSAGTDISVLDLPQALDVQPRLDIIAFDASLMQMAEVAYQLRHYGRVMVGSEDSPPGPGYPYHTFLAALVATPTMTREQFAEEIVVRTLDYYYDFYGYSPPLTQSAVTLAGMDGVAVAVDGLARALTGAMPAYSAQITSARTQAQGYAYPENKDLYHFAQLVGQLVPKQDVVQTSQAVMLAIEDAVFAEAHGEPRSNSYGLAIFIPGSSDYNSFYRSRYQQLELSTNTAWDNWLSVSPP